MESDYSYVFSGSSTHEEKKMKKKFTRIQSKYKQSTINKRYGKKKRKHIFYGTNIEAKSVAKKSPTKIISSLEKFSDRHAQSNTSQIFDIEHLQHVLSGAHVCRKGGRLKFIPDVVPCMGLFHQNILRCTKCGKQTPMTNYPVIHPIETTQQEPNKLLALAVASTGVGYSATRAIMSTLSLSLQSERTFLKHLHHFYDDIYNYAQEHFRNIITNIKYRNKKPEDIMDIVVSIDGTWKRRGHVSNYGLVFVIDVHSGLCIDFEVMSLYCETCAKKRRELSKTSFTRWYKKHQHLCSKNYDGTSKSMEKQGVIKLYQRSLVNGLRYKYMVCDGDTSAFEAVKYYYVEQYQQQQRQQQHALFEKNTIRSYSDDEEDNEGDNSRSNSMSEDNEDDYDSTSDSLSEDNENDDGSTSDSMSKDNEDDDGSTSDSMSVANENDDSSTSDSLSEGNEDNDGSTSDSMSVANDDDDGSGSDSMSEDNENDDILKKFIVIKEDCVNHVGKRVMKYLLDIKKEKTRRIPVVRRTTSGVSSSTTNIGHTARQLLDDNKPWGGKAGRMTDQMMKKLSNSYGLAIRQGGKLTSNEEINHTLSTMKKCCRASFYHYIKTSDDNEEQQHKYCPKTSDTWCFYHRMKLQPVDKKPNIEMSNRKRITLDPIFRQILKPMIRKLTSKKLLRRCLRGVTQNSNESLNSVVWSLLTKSKHHGFRSVRGSAALAAMYFNSGSKILLKYFKERGLKVSEILCKHLFQKDKKRSYKSKKSKENRDDRIKKKTNDREKAIKALSDATDYYPGGFNN